MKASILLKCCLPVTVWLATMAISTPAYPQEKIEFYTTPTIPYSGNTIHAYATDFGDTLSGDTLYQVRAKNGFPVSYHRKIRTSVCFDNKCRLLRVIVHWNITGRYLGFELPAGEYLSKAEHDPFTQQEYVRLHSLLQDPNSPLGSFSYNELVPSKVESNPDVDAVSSPTAKNLLEFVVEGAAYTTYKLWHIIHGVTREAISQRTVDVFTVDLLAEILASPDVSDRIWALNHRHHMKETSPKIQDVVLSFVTSDEFSLAERAIQSIGSRDMRDENFQLHLLEKFDRASYALKKRIIEKFGLAPGLSGAPMLSLAGKLRDVSGELVSSILDVFSKQGIADVEVARQVCGLLSDENVFISRQAYEFLRAMEPTDKKINEELIRYRLRHNLK